MTTARRARLMPKLKPGNVVIRPHRLLTTQGTVVRYGGEDDNGASRAWIRRDHPTTLPDPSLEPLDDVELVEGDVGVTWSSAMVDSQLSLRETARKVVNMVIPSVVRRVTVSPRCSRRTAAGDRC